MRPMSTSRHIVRIIDPPPDTPLCTSLRRARKAIRLELAVWVVEGVSMRLAAHAARVHRPVHARPSLPAPRWLECWRTCEAAVLQPYQPYQPYQRGTA